MNDHILFLGTSDEGGVSIYVSNLIKDMQDFSFYIPGKDIFSQQIMAGLYPKANILKFDQNYSFLTLYARAKKLDVIIQEHKINIIHAHVLRFGLLGAIYKKYFNNDIRLIYTGHGSRYIQKQKKFKQWLFKKLEIFVNSMSDHVVFIRDIDYKNSQKNNLLPTKKATVIKTQIQLSQKNQNCFSIREKYHIRTDKIIAMIGSVYDIKNPFLLCDIAREILNKRTDVTFLWIGNGPMLVQMQDYIASKGLADNIKFIGAIDYQNMNTVWDELDILLLTSKVEIFPLIVLEAYQSKVLVLSTNFFGVNEVIQDGFTGYVFNMKNTSQAVDKLENIFTYGKIAHEIKENALIFYNDNFGDVTKMKNKYKKIYLGYKNVNN